ncbi:DNA polymerase IV [Veillonella criceti]|uniref:DNA polymerase IV n=1 Tax=Veillonella criceti TaxID=103891 RepID=A0A380NNY6_9FIRM|nr:DNA polymerase IV [Veillonella criceti]SUP44144.1 DNA polymerase IV [Veillonella criceti]
MRRWIMHVDMDAFYASVEQRDNPEYRGRPVIVGGLSSRGVVATASYEARKLGVHSAMSIVKAKELCPDGIYLRPRFAVYHAISEQVHEIMHRYTPYIEPLSLDEAFLDVTGLHGQFTGPYALGKAIKDDIWKATGLIASVGVAPNKYLAKLASDIKKPNGLVVIPYGQEAQFVAPLPVKRLWGVGRHMEKRLQAAGFYTIGQLAALPHEGALKSIVGNQAKRLYDMARGIDERPVEYERQIHSIGNELTYEHDLEDSEVIDREWYYFAHKVAKRLRQHNLKGRTIAIKVRFNDFETISRQKRIEIATDSEETLYRVGMMLYNKLNINKPIRLLGLTVSDFAETWGQTSLFEEETSQEDLAKAVDGLEAKFGEGIVMKGALWERANQQKREEENHNETI